MFGAVARTSVCAVAETAITPLPKIKSASPADTGAGIKNELPPVPLVAPSVPVCPGDPVEPVNIELNPLGPVRVASVLLGPAEKLEFPAK